MENTPHVAGDQQASIQHGEPRAENAEQPAADSTIRVPPFALTDEQEKAVRASLVQTRPNVRAEMAAHIAPFITLQKWTEQPYPAPAPSADPQEPKPHESADLDSLQESPFIDIPLPAPSADPEATQPHKPADLEALPEAPVIDLPTNEVNESWQIPFGRRVQNLTRQLRQQGIRVTLIEASDQLHRLLFGLPTVRYSEITPHVFIGGQHHSKGWLDLQARGVTAVINMRRESDDRARGLAPERYLHLMTLDNSPPTQDQLREGIHFIHEEIMRGGKVYIHCWEGVGRAPTMCAAYLVSTGLTADEAWAQIRAVRPFIRPTPFQVRQVEMFAKRFGSGSSEATESAAD